MSRKTSSRKPVTKTISPLLGSIALANGVRGSNPLLLKSLIALDALHRGHATTNLLTLLGQQLLISEELCLAGYERAHLKSVRDAHAVLVKVDGDAVSKHHWKAVGAEYEALREALAVYDVQLRRAPRAQVRDAQLATMNRLLDYLERSGQPPARAQPIARST